MFRCTTGHTWLFLCAALAVQGCGDDSGGGTMMDPDDVMANSSGGTGGDSSATSSGDSGSSTDGSSAGSGSGTGSGSSTGSGSGGSGAAGDPVSFGETTLAMSEPAGLGALFKADMMIAKGLYKAIALHFPEGIEPNGSFAVAYGGAERDTTSVPFDFLKLGDTLVDVDADGKLETEAFDLDFTDMIQATLDANSTVKNSLDGSPTLIAQDMVYTATLGPDGTTLESGLLTGWLTKADLESFRFKNPGLTCTFGLDCGTCTTPNLPKNGAELAACHGVTPEGDRYSVVLEVEEGVIDLNVP